MTRALTKDLFTSVMTEMITSAEQHWTIICWLCMTVVCLQCEALKWILFQPWNQNEMTWSCDRSYSSSIPPFSLVSEHSLTHILSLSLSETTCQCHSLKAACAGNAAWTTVASSAQCVHMGLIRHILGLKHHVRLHSHTKWQSAEEAVPAP